jgi:hypothetical protein
MCTFKGMSTELQTVSKEFIEEQINASKQKKNSRKGGRYSKQDRDARRNEVHKLYFEYGYSARKISELMKINRNTINGDIQYWYSKIVNNNNIFNPEYSIINNIQRLEIQRTRLREQIDKTESFQERLSIERLIFEIDSKILHTYQKLADSSRRLLDVSSEWMNDWFKKNHKTERYITLFDTISVSETAKEKINQIINEDRKKARFY